MGGGVGTFFLLSSSPSANDNKIVLSPPPPPPALPRLPSPPPCPLHDEALPRNSKHFKRPCSQIFKSHLTSQQSKDETEDNLRRIERKIRNRNFHSLVGRRQTRKMGVLSPSSFLFLSHLSPPRHPSMQKIFLLFPPRHPTPMNNSRERKKQV